MIIPYYYLVDLKKHNAAVHKGEKNFKCDICQKLFSWKADVKRHVKKVHEGRK